LSPAETWPVHGSVDVAAGRLSPMAWSIIAWIALAALTPITAGRWLAVELLILSFAYGLAGIDFRSVASRWRGVLLTILFLAICVALGHPKRAELGWFSLLSGILLKNVVLFGTIAALSESVGHVRMLGTMARLGLPTELVSTISMMARYGPLLSDQTRRMKRARQSRMIRKSLPGVWLIQSGGLATLLSSALRRSQRIHAAMLSRGWQSRGQSLE
jgi:energy-coupling factor transporter transmembrane protein EcfT